MLPLSRIQSLRKKLGLFQKRKKRPLLTDWTFEEGLAHWKLALATKREPVVYEPVVMKIGCFYNNAGDAEVLRPVIQQLVEAMDSKHPVDLSPDERGSKVLLGLFFVRLSTPRLAEKVNRESWERANQRAAHVVIIATADAKAFPKLQSISGVKSWLNPEGVCQIIYSGFPDFNSPPKLYEDKEQHNKHTLDVIGTITTKYF